MRKLNDSKSSQVGGIVRKSEVVIIQILEISHQPITRNGNQYSYVLYRYGNDDLLTYIQPSDP